MKYEERKAVFEAALAKYEPACRELAVWLGDHPELSRQEKESSARITALLESEGFAVERDLADLPYSFRAVKLPGGKHLKHKMAILTEYDALPGFGPDGGPGHACGHNLSCAFSVLAGLALSGLQEDLDTEIHVVGTPREEVIEGKVMLEKAGIWNAYDFAMMVHVDADNMTSPIALATSQLTVVYQGKASHASGAPWLGQNALNGARLTLDAIDMLRQHMKPGCQVHGALVEGGVVVNIIPDRAKLNLQARAYTYNDVLELQERIFRCIEGAAMATETKADITVLHEPIKDLKFNASADRMAAESFAECGLELTPRRIFASTDAGNVSYVCPALQPTLKIAPAGTGLHTPAMEQCARSEEGLSHIADGARILGYTAMKVFDSEESLSAVRTDFEQE
ncbi:MAG: amidohydrolase [Firmicutes bacterium]|nr:amidohydrolase [Bacillota bacterium]